MFSLNNVNELEEFRNYLKNERGLAGGSVYNYLSNLKRFRLFVKKSLLKTETSDISNYLAYLQGKEMDGATLCVIASVLKTFYSWANYYHGSLSLKKIYLYLINVVRIKKDHKIPFIPKRQEIEQMRLTLRRYKELISFDRQSYEYKHTLLAYTIFEVLVTTGMRSVEVRSLRRKDVDIDNRTVFIKHGKGDYQRLSVFGKSAVELLKEHLELNNFQPDDFIFPVKRCNVLNYMIRHWAKRANVSSEIHAHSFRHYFITESQRQGVSIQVVAEQVGHRNLNTTKMYTHFTTDFIKERYGSVEI